jgi:hypothetical protein
VDTAENGNYVYVRPVSSCFCTRIHPLSVPLPVMRAIKCFLARLVYPSRCSGNCICDDGARALAGGLQGLTALKSISFT